MSGRSDYVSAGFRGTARSGLGDWSVGWMVRGALGAGAQPDRAQPSAHGGVRAFEHRGEAGRVERVMQAQELVLLLRPAPTLAGRGRGHGRLDPEPRCAPADRLRGPTEALGHLLERAPAGCQSCQVLVDRPCSSAARS